MVSFYRIQVQLQLENFEPIKIHLNEKIHLYDDFRIVMDIEDWVPWVKRERNNHPIFFFVIDLQFYDNI